MKDSDNTTQESSYGFFAHQHLCEAIEHGQDIHLCTVGEYLVLQTFRKLSLPAGRLFSQLLTRSKTIFRLDSFASGFIDNFEELQTSKLIIGLNQERSYETFNYYSLKELYKLCKVYGCDKKGKKQQIIERLLKSSAPPPLLHSVCYSSLFKRFFRKLYLQTQINWSQPVVSALYDQRNYPYLVTPRVIHTCRQQYRDYRLFHSLYRTSDRFFDLPTPSIDFDVPYRFRGARYHRKYVYKIGLLLEKENPELAHDIFLKLQPHIPALQRMLALFRTHKQPNILFSQTKDLLHREKLETAITLFRSLGPLCRHHKFRRGMPPNYRKPAQRIMRVTPAEKGPKFTYKDSLLSIEELIIQHLRDHGCVAFFAENNFWSALRNILFLHAIYSTTGAQFPSPHQHAPMDFYSPSFYDSRMDECEDVLLRIEQGKAWEIFQENLPDDDIHILGQQYHKINKEHYLLFFQHIPVQSLVQILRYLLRNPRIHGMPDIIAYFPDQFSCPFVTPSIIKNRMLFIEAKSQSDTIRPNQEAMHHVLLTHSLSVEIWKQKRE